MDHEAEHESDEVLIPSSDDPAHPGDIKLPGGVMAPEPIVGKDVSTPLEEDEPEGTIPPCPLWAMKNRRHIQWHLLPSHDRHERIRECLGTGDEVVYVIDDGRHHVMLGRRVGASRDQCEYCLLGRVESEVYDKLRDGELPVAHAFDTAGELDLCGVVVEQGIRSSNIFDVAHYAGIAEVPEEYRPGAPYLTLEEDLDIS